MAVTEMQRLARVEGGKVAEVFELPAGFDVVRVFPPDWRAALHSVGPDVAAGWTFDGGSFAPPVSRPDDLAAFRTTMLATVDARAEAERLRWITPGAGQAMTYARKVDEAKALQAATGEPQPDAYPMLAASLGIDGATLQAVAAKVLQMDAAWAVVGAAIEARRLTLKRDIAAAGSAEALTLIDITAGWPA